MQRIDLVGLSGRFSSIVSQLSIAIVLNCQRRVTVTLPTLTQLHRTTRSLLFAIDRFCNTFSKKPIYNGLLLGLAHFNLSCCKHDFRKPGFG